MMSCANLITKVSWKEQLKKNWSNHPSEEFLQKLKSQDLL